MPTDRQLFIAIALPAVISLALTLIVLGERRPRMFPGVLGVSFLAAYWLLRQPALPPQDGSDWLFSLTIPLALLCAFLPTAPAARTIAGGTAGVIALIILRPIAAAIGPAALWSAFAILGVAGAIVATTLPWAAGRTGSTSVAAAMTILMAAAALLIASSNFLTYGLIGFSAASAMVPITLGLGFVERRLPAQSGDAMYALTVLFTGIFSGLLAGARHYPHTGLSPFHFYLLLTTLILLPLPSLLPHKHVWLRRFTTIVFPALVFAVAISVARTAIDAALKF